MSYKQKCCDWYLFLELFHSLTDSKEIINTSIQNYVLKLFKKRKNKESKTNQTKKPVNKPIINNCNSNKNTNENIQSSSESGTNFFCFVK